jgi:membrane protease YdiL (CAAX protease family)
MMASATIAVSLLFPGVRYSPDMAGLFERLRPTIPPEQIEQTRSQALASPIHPFWLGLLQALIIGPTINAVAGFGEELGWRGLLQKELSYMGFWKSSAIIGLIWGVWHAPLILQDHNYPQHPVIGVWMMIVWTLLLSPIFSYVRLKARSVIAAAIIHGSINASFGLSIMVISGGDDLTVGLAGAAGILVLVIVNLCLYAYERFLAIELIDSFISPSK